jgi:RNA polymerase sigma-70 factor (ECF subfamily)
MDEEAILVQHARSGSEEAFTRLVEAYQDSVYNLAYRMLGDAAEAEDAAQETFVRLYTRLSTYDARRKFSSWLLSIASHHCIDRLRRRKPETSLENVVKWRSMPDSSADPEGYALQAERGAEIQQLLSELPAHYRAVIVLRYWHEMSYDEIASTLGATESTIKSRLHRARRMMAENLGSRRFRPRAELEDRRVMEDAVL